MAEISSVVEGATLSCSLGTSTSNLQVPTCHGAILSGQNQADISDSTGNVNIMSFVSCKRQIPPVPCVPTTCLKWVLGKTDHTLLDELALLNICIIPCVFGGIIKIDDDGQRK